MWPSNVPISDISADGTEPRSLARTLQWLGPVMSSGMGLRHEEPLRQHRPGEQPPGNPGAVIAAIAELLGTSGNIWQPWATRSIAIIGMPWHAH